jgi:acyl-CoA thioesterase-1
VEFQSGDTIVFIGDSITDCGRLNDPEGLGDGYVRTIRDYLWLFQPEKKWTILNRGIGGDKVEHLLARWEADVMQLKPDWVSISIGINDEAFNTTIEDYRNGYRSLLEQTKRNTDAEIILLETTINLEVESSAIRSLNAYNDVIHELAQEFKTTVIPMNKVFSSYLQKETGNSLTYDHVHMNSTGNLLMAMTWIKECGLV